MQIKQGVLFFLVISMVSCKVRKGGDPLNNRSFTISMDEIRYGQAASKLVDDKIRFKKGRMYSDFIFKKFGYAWVRYRITVDTTFIDSTGAEIRQIALQGNETNKTNQTYLFELLTQEWDIEGTMRITLNDMPKKYYDFVGREKRGKPQRIRKTKPILEYIPTDSEQPANP